MGSSKIGSVADRDAGWISHQLSGELMAAARRIKEKM